MLKRLIDLLVAFSLLILLSPLMLLTAILIRLAIGSPVIFRQERPGLHAKPFRLYKFRTMSDVSDKRGNLLSDEQRMTRFGQKLRRWSLDELPQLINVIKGDISLIGPRPLLMEYLPLYSSEQARRHDVRPGITGWAQVNGRNAVDWDDRLKMDVWYVDHQSLWLDMKILIMTFLKVFKGEGVSQPGRVTMDKFRGSKHE